MTIIQLEYLIAVVNHGSFSVAAEHCFATQSALSKQISLLEDELGAVLLDRIGRPIVPTETGKVFIESAKKTVGMFYASKEAINDLKGKLFGKIRIAVIPTISPYLIPKFTTRFAKRCPNIKFEIMDMFTEDIVDALNHDLIDIAIMSGGQSEVKIKETELFEERLMMYVSRDNELYGHKSIAVEEVDVRKLLIMAKVHCLRNQSLRLCQERKKIELQYDFICCSLETLAHTADNIGGTTIIPAMAIGYIPENKHDQIIPLESERASRKITMAVGRTFMRDSIIDAVKKSIMEAHEELKIAEFLIG